MMKSECEICRGQRRVRLPVYKAASAAPFDGHTKTMGEAYREFPCPECSDQIPIERVHAATELGLADSRYVDAPGFRDHINAMLADQLAHFLLREGYIEFEKGPVDEKQLNFGVRATLGVVSPKQIESLDERISKRQTEVAEQVATEAKHQISNWGAFYGHLQISKADAHRMVDDAIRIVMAKRAAWKPMARTD